MGDIIQPIEQQKQAGMTAHAEKQGAEMAHIYTSADQLIGGTPLLELTRLEARYGLNTGILAKQE